MKEVMIVAAEASSAFFAQRLLEHWKANKVEVHAFGVGTQAMEDLGFERLGKSEEMAVVGAAEIIEQWGKLKSVFDRLVSEAKKRRPAVVVVMDYPEFNLYLSRKLHALGIKVVYYVSPQVWAWRKGRVFTIKKFCEKVLVLFPFEVKFYQDKGVPVDFVGHPVLDEIEAKYFTDEYRKEHRQRYGIRDDEIVIGLMPGSRNGEIRQHLDIQLEVARLLSTTYKNVRVMLMVAPTFKKADIQEKLGDLQFPLIVIQDVPMEMIHLADYVLVASGTATLMVGLLHKPMVIMYKLKWLTGIFAKLVVHGVKFFGLVNLILGREVVPERWQKGTEPKKLFELMKRYIDDPAHTESVKKELRTLQSYLGDKGATARVAKSLEAYL